MSNLVIAFSAIAPLIVYMLLGCGLRKLEHYSDEAISSMNSMVFKLLLPITTFLAIYSSDLGKTFNLPFIAYAISCIFFVYFISYFTVCAFSKDNYKRGAMIQAIFRSNFVLIGVAIIENIYGHDAIALPLFMTVFVSVSYNLLAVFTFERFRGGQAKIHWNKMLISFATNPMVLGSAFGLLFRCLPPMPDFLLISLRRIALATTPIAMIVLGMSFKLQTVTNDLRELVFCLVGRLIVAPLIIVCISFLLGFRGYELGLLLCMTMGPCAVASYPMAEQMGGDAPLAGAAVVFTAILSCFTMFLWVFVMKTLEII
jgi:predicted permease